MRTKRLYFLLYLSLLVAQKAYTLQDDTNQPMVFEANLVVIDDETGNHIYSGNVLMTQGSIMVKAERLEVLNKEGQPAHLIATGNQQSDGRALFRQTTDQQMVVQATGQKIEYYEKKSHLLLLGEAELNRGRDVFKGHQINYNTETHRMLAGTPNPKSDNLPPTIPNNGRVHVTIYPKSEPSETEQKPENTPKQQDPTKKPGEQTATNTQIPPQNPTD